MKVKHETKRGAAGLRYRVTLPDGRVTGWCKSRCAALTKAAKLKWKTGGKNNDQG